MFTRNDVQILEENAEGWNGHCKLVQVGGRKFFVSAISNMWGTETFAFETKDGVEVWDWMETAGVRVYDHEACIAELLDAVNNSADYIDAEVLSITS